MKEWVIACGDYDRTRDLREHRTILDGAEYTYLTLPPAEIFWRMHRFEEFDISEMSLGSYCVGLARGDRRFVALPVFPSRVFRHGSLWVREDSPIRDPRDLLGCRVGVPEYDMTAAIWVKGWLHDEHEIQAEDVQWVLGRVPKHTEALFNPRIRIISRGTVDLPRALERGEIDALTAAIPPPGLGKAVRRLLPDYAERERRYWQRFRIFPIMHTLVMRRAVYETAPWLARSVYKAFCHAKDSAEARLFQSNALPYMLPWAVSEAERTRDLMGSDFWAYGVEPNRPTLEAFTRHLVEQGLNADRLNADALFLEGEWTNAWT